MHNVLQGRIEGSVARLWILIGGLCGRVGREAGAVLDLFGGLLEVAIESDANASGRRCAEAGGVIGENRHILQRDVTDVCDDLLPELGVCAAADDLHAVDGLPLAEDAGDLAEAEGHALEHGAEEMLALVHGRHTEEDALRLFVHNRRTFAVEVRQVDQALAAGRDRGRGGVERARRDDLKDLLRPADRAAGAHGLAGDVIRLAIHGADIKDAVIRVEERLGQLRGDPGAALKLHEHIAVFRRAAADVGTGRRPAADRHRDARAQAEMACRFFGQMAGNLTAGMDRGEFVRVEIDGTEKVPVVGAAAEADECAVGGVGKVGRVEIAGQAVDKIVLGLENFIGLFVKLRLFMAEPDALAERVLGDEHIARLAVEIVAAKAFLQRFGPLRGPAVAVNHGALERLSVAIHRQAAPHVAADANGVDALDIFGHKLAQHQHRAHGAHPPVRSVLLHHAAGTAAGGIGGGDVAQNIQILVHQRSLQPAGANVKYQ